MESEKLEKKKYIAPSMEEIEMECRQFLCDSCTNPDGCVSMPAEIE